MKVGLTLAQRRDDSTDVGTTLGQPTLLSGIYASGNWANIGSGNVLSPGRRQAIIWTNDDLLSIGPLGNLQWNWSQNKQLFIHENVVCKMAAILFRGRWVKTYFSSICGDRVRPCFCYDFYRVSDQGTAHRACHLPMHRHPFLVPFVNITWIWNYFHQKILFRREDIFGLWKSRRMRIS